MLSYFVTSVVLAHPVCPARFNSSATDFPAVPSMSAMTTPRAFLGEPFGVGLAQSVSASGDDGDLVLESHGCLPVSDGGEYSITGRAVPGGTVND